MGLCSRPPSKISLTFDEVWDGLSDARINFSAAEMVTPGVPSPPQLSTLVENLNLQRALLHHISGMSSVNVVDKTKVQTIQKEEREGNSWPLVHLSDGRVLRARLLVSYNEVCAYTGSLILHRLVQTVSTPLCVHSQGSSHTAGHTIPKQSSRR